MKFIQLKYVSILLLMLLTLASCNGDKCKKCRGGSYENRIPLNKVDNVYLQTDGELIVYQSTTQLAALIGPDIFSQQVNTNVENGNWFINFNKCINCSEKPTFVLQFIDLKSIQLEGSGNINSEETITLDSLDIVNKGSGKIFIKQINGSKYKITNTGSGDIEIKGVAGSLNIINTGSGIIQNMSIPAENIEVVNSGSGSIYVTATSTLNVTITGSGNVHYKGAPVITQNISGSGQLINDN